MKLIKSVFTVIALSLSTVTSPAIAQTSISPPEQYRQDIAYFADDTIASPAILDMNVLNLYFDLRPALCNVLLNPSTDIETLASHLEYRISLQGVSPRYASSFAFGLIMATTQPGACD